MEMSAVLVVYTIIIVVRMSVYSKMNKSMVILVIDISLGFRYILLFTAYCILYCILGKAVVIKWSMTAVIDNSMQ